MRLVSRRTSTYFCVFFPLIQQRALLCFVQTCSRGIVVWCVGRWTYRGIVVLWLLLILLVWSLTVALR